MKCPKCNHGQLVSKKTQENEYGVVRVRTCDMCGHTTRTMERIFAPVKQHRSPQ